MGKRQGVGIEQNLSPVMAPVPKHQGHPLPWGIALALEGHKCKNSAGAEIKERKTELWGEREEMDGCSGLRWRTYTST